MELKWLNTNKPKTTWWKKWLTENLWKKEKREWKKKIIVDDDKSDDENK